MSAAAPPPLAVVAAVLPGARPGEVLAFRRAPGRHHAGLWEFPGGKVEPGETPRAALARELAEELAVEVAVGERLWEGRHGGERPLVITFFAGRVVGGSLALHAHDAVRSVRPAAARELPWAPIDGAFVAWLADR